MTTTSTSVSVGAQAGQQRAIPTASLIVLWQIIVGVLSLYGATQILQIESLLQSNLAPVIKVFLTAAAALFGLISLASVPWLLRTDNRGRLLAMVVDFVGAIIAGLVVGHLLNLYIGIDSLADGLARNSSGLLAIAAGYLVVWAGGRFDERSTVHHWLTRIGLGIMMLALVATLWLSGLPDSIGSLISGLFQPLTLLVLVAAVIFAVVVLVLLRTGERFGETIAQRESWQGWLFLMPNFVSFMLFFALPLLLSLYLSFTDSDAVSKLNFVGLNNYTDLLSLDIQATGDFTAPLTFRQNHFEIARITVGGGGLVIAARDPLFWQSLAQTFRYCLMLMVLSVVPALGLAMLLNSKIPGMKFFRAVYFLPSIAAVVGVSLIWRWLYDPTIGYINFVINQFVGFLNNTLGLQIADPKVNWLADDNVLLVSVVIMAAWQAIGFNTVIFLAGLQGIPKELIEASTVDGAGRWVRFRKLILPMLAPTTFFILVTTLISGFQVFSEVFVLLANSTSNARLTTVFYLYQQGFVLFRMGYASAVAWVLTVVIFIVTLLQFRVSSRNEAYAD